MTDDEMNRLILLRNKLAEKWADGYDGRPYGEMGFKAGFDAALKLAKEALEFYSEYEHPPDGRSNNKTTLDVDNGKKAREVLAKWNGKI